MDLWPERQQLRQTHDENLAPIRNARMLRNMDRIGRRRGAALAPANDLS
jgi:hypothetical protein